MTDGSQKVNQLQYKAIRYFFYFAHTNPFLNFWIQSIEQQGILHPHQCRALKSNTSAPLLQPSGLLALKPSLVMMNQISCKYCQPQKVYKLMALGQMKEDSGVGQKDPCQVSYRIKNKRKQNLA